MPCEEVDVVSGSAAHIVEVGHPVNVVGSFTVSAVERAGPCQYFMALARTAPGNPQSVGLVPDPVVPLTDYTMVYVPTTPGQHDFYVYVTHSGGNLDDGFYAYQIDSVPFSIQVVAAHKHVDAELPERTGVASLPAASGDAELPERAGTASLPQRSGDAEIEKDDGEASI